MMLRCYCILILSGLLILVVIFDILSIRIIQNNIVANQRIGLTASNRTNEKKKVNFIPYKFTNRSTEVHAIQGRITKSIKTLPERYFRPNSHYKYILRNIFNELNVNKNVSSNIVEIVNNVSKHLFDN